MWSYQFLVRLFLYIIYLCALYVNTSTWSATIIHYLPTFSRGTVDSFSERCHIIWTAMTEWFVYIINLNNRIGLCWKHHWFSFAITLNDNRPTHMSNHQDVYTVNHVNAELTLRLERYTLSMSIYSRTPASWRSTFLKTTTIRIQTWQATCESSVVDGTMALPSRRSCT